MEILCSGEKYSNPIDPSICLTCAQSDRNTPCGYSFPVLNAILGSQQNRTQEIHVTDLTSCLRRAYHNKVNHRPQYIHELLKMFIGSAVHDYIEKYNTPETSEVKIDDSNIHGCIDYVDKGHIIDFKTTRWMKTDKLPYSSHELQVNYYSGFRPEVTSASIQYIDLSGPSTCRACRVDMRMINGQIQCPKCGYKGDHLGAYQHEVTLWDKDLNKSEIEDRAEQLRFALDVGSEPPPEPSYLCKYSCPALDCEYNKE